MALSPAEVRHIAALARLGLDDGEVELLGEQLGAILDHFDTLRDLPTGDVEPTAHTLPLTNVMREDLAADSLPTEDVLANAPRRDGDYIRVRAVLD
jgi:aspartyl-tRNA(Asn)/glutamyl-tRNA(Gln) amidotransferase subunit C